MVAFHLHGLAHIFLVLLQVVPADLNRSLLILQLSKARRLCQGFLGLDGLSSLPPMLFLCIHVCKPSMKLRCLSVRDLPSADNVSRCTLWCPSCVDVTTLLPGWCNLRLYRPLQTVSGVRYRRYHLLKYTCTYICMRWILGTCDFLLQMPDILEVAALLLQLMLSLDCSALVLGTGCSIPVCGCFFPFCPCRSYLPVRGSICLWIIPSLLFLPCVLLQPCAESDRGAES